ncbi:MAG: ATP-grasp domain-containing protein [Bacteroidota bacterium]
MSKPDPKIKLAILYQAHKPPIFEGIIKPMKHGGYSDSGADIAFALKDEIEIITPVGKAEEKSDIDWVFPDTAEGIQQALDKGATHFWLNTLLYEGHPAEPFMEGSNYWIGQVPALVGKHDDKHLTNEFLHEKGLPISRSLIFEKDTLDVKEKPPFPLVIKPIRGRGSKGVKVVENRNQFIRESLKLLESKRFGNKMMVESFLPGQEITIALMPTGKYVIKGEEVVKNEIWNLPPLKRENHLKGIAPYSGIVPVSHNSFALENEELKDLNLKKIIESSKKLGQLLDIRAPIRIDARQNSEGKYFIFDVNFKPNMGGASRKHRKRQDSLVMIAARSMSWTYKDLLLNILRQAWK